ncbi:MAG: VapC toxin family PIN domain ribonuclease [Acidobacteriia bacterium]|nr:VapC toxin family PIN domain ribonuclease [Terriglobia bacterium]
MNTFLLDVNVLIALAWPDHSAHRLVQRWFARTGCHSWATCPFTEAAFVRILSNPSFSERAVTPAEALDALRISTRRTGHHFWTDDVSFEEAVRTFQGRIAGHQQVTDAYLLGLVLHRKGRLATLDRAILALLSDHPQRDVLEVISA